jgi:hypothetical protein
MHKPTLATAKFLGMDGTVRRREHHALAHFELVEFLHIALPGLRCLIAAA